MSKIKIALAGCGRISKNHFEAIQKLSDQFEIVGVCDIVKDRADTASNLYVAPAYYDYTELLKNSGAELVSLCTPSGIHPEQAIEASKYGINVVSEKPMGVRFEDGLEMVKACKEAGVKLFVVKQNRLNVTVQKLKDAIDSGRFGKLYMISSNVFWTRPQEYYDMASWRGTWEYDGGAFMNQASHYVDLLQYLFGPVESVHSFTGTLARNIEAEDSGVVNLKWSGGALGSMNVTMLTYPKNLEGSITVLGEKGTARIGGTALNKIEVWDFRKPVESDKSVFDSSYETASVYGFGHFNYYENVADVLLNGAQPITDGDEGLKSLRLLCSIYKSNHENKSVRLDEL